MNEPMTLISLLQEQTGPLQVRKQPSNITFAPMTSATTRIPIITKFPDRKHYLVQTLEKKEQIDGL